MEEQLSGRSCDADDHAERFDRDKSGTPGAGQSDSDAECTPNFDICDVDDLSQISAYERLICGIDTEFGFVI
jgi:hypothetical protein